jgi:ATP-dependent helicase Lhr and Lhr-like helicase
MTSIGTTGDFHPAVATWFARRFPDGPSAPQREGWPHIRAGEDTLIAAPTGSGKTLTGFLVAIDSLYRAFENGDDLGQATSVVYVSPLKALAVDIHQNLEQPLAEIAAVAAELGLAAPDITVGVRTGDTPASARTAMVSRPPLLLVTTPESLYLLVTAERSRRTLGRVKTVIVDEIHALARDKRGSHLSLTLERLDHVQAGPRPQRIGLSATQRPIERVAQLLTGVGSGRSAAIVDCGHGRQLRVALGLPGSELNAVASTEQFGEMVDLIAAQVRQHRTTLVFVNTRRMSERLAHLLAERLGTEDVAAHHGSLSKDRRLRVEERLRAGELRALVATASLELGIDIGPIELVCQVGSPRSIATFLQRVGRSNHSLSGVPEAILYPLSRDELVECAALLAAVRAGDLDAIVSPVAPLDILAQQIVAEVAGAEEWDEQGLYQLCRHAAPYAGLTPEQFESVVVLVSEGITTGRGRRMAYVHRDQVNGVLRPRRGARLAALTSGGAIAEVGDYRVLLDPDNTVVGTVNEDFAIESMAGDVFLLGSHSWRVRRVESGVVRVVDAEGMHPTIPFWIGEAPSRTAELSVAVSELRQRVGAALAQSTDDLQPARFAVEEACGVTAEVSEQLVAYLAAGREALGVIPSQEDVVYERFFDEAGGMQLVIHAPFGGRVNKGLGLALRKRFCATFDFELQAAASDDAIVLSLGPQHSFALESVPRFLRSDTVPAVLSQAVLASPMFASRWRWNLNRALAVLRFRGGRKNPLPIQRMEADDLMAAVFPALAACQENTGGGPVPIPDHVLVHQTLDDCLHEAMDVDAVVGLVRSMEEGAVRLHFVDSIEPSVFSHEILNGKPFTFLDDAPLEERRTRAVQVRRGLPLEDQNLARLDGAAVQRVRDEVDPEPRDAEELHDLLLSLVVVRPSERYRGWFEELMAAGRALTVRLDGGEKGHGPDDHGHDAGTDDDAVLWCAVERRRWAGALFPAAACHPAATPPGLVPAEAIDPDVAAADVVRGHLDTSGPVTVDALSQATALSPSRVAVGLGRLEAEGFALRGRFDPDLGDVEQWCARRLLARIHSYTQTRLRREIEPVTAQDFMRFLLEWQHVAPGTQREGRAGVLAVVDQLQGFEIPIGAWEESVLSARVENYQPQWLDDLCLSGELAWGRLSLRGADQGARSDRGASTPSRATPVTFTLREDLPWLLRAVRGEAVPAEPPHGAAHDLLAVLADRGALFHSELRAATGRLPVEVEEGLWDLVARGLVTADGFQAVRSLWSARDVWRRRRRDARSRLGSRRSASWRDGGDGRWALLRRDEDHEDIDELAERVAAQLLARWGVVFWDLSTRETMSVPWREVRWALRRLEARGLVRGGRFVTGFTGEQYALPEAVDELRRIRRRQHRDEIVRLSAADPLNLVGIVLPGDRVPAVRTRRIAYQDGLPIEDPTPGLIGGRRAVGG